jgi:hypothetical protein
MERTFTIYPNDLTQAAQDRLNEALKETSGETIDDTNWDVSGLAEVIMPESEPT